MNKCDLKIVTNRKTYLKWSFRPTFRKEKQLENGLILIEKDKCRINLNKTTDIGASILEHVYMRPEVNSNQFEILNSCENLFCSH